MSGSSKTTEKEEVKVPPLQNFRAHREVESFYRFIYENDLRREAAKVLKFVYKALGLGKKVAKDKKVQ